MNIQWYPGHMAKAMRRMKEELKNVDVVAVMGDARAVRRSINPDFLELIRQKRVIYIFNKSDLAEDSVTKEWERFFKQEELPVFFIDCLNKKGIGALKNYLQSFRQTFRFEREVRVMIAGVPNVGKSMLINTLARRAAAEAANRPGVTKGTRWIKVTNAYYLLDTPGVLPPKFETEEDGIVLSALGSVKDTIFDKEELAMNLIGYLMEHYPDALTERYKLTELSDDKLIVMEAIAARRGFKTKGGMFDYERTANMILDEFKNGTIGRFSFDMPEEGIWSLPTNAR